MTVRTHVAVAALAAGCLIGSVALAQTVTKAEEKATVTATIKQIDKTTRVITFANPDGTEDSVVAGPEVRRFDELKVGDKVTLTYYASRVFRLRKPGDPPLPPPTAAITPSAGKSPGGTMGVQTTATVTVKAIDQAAGTITVLTSDGRTVVRKVEDKKNLTGVKVGDKIDIIYTEALLASVEPAKK